MAFHKMILIGRLVNEPTVRTFANGGRVAKFGLPVDFTRRKKNPTTGQWEGESFIIDVDAFNRDNGQKLADLVEQYLHKGSQVYVEGRLKPNEYTDREGKKVFKPVLVADNIQFLDPRAEGVQGSEEGAYSPRPTSAQAPRKAPSAAPAYSPPANHSNYDEPAPDHVEEQGGGDDIPF